MQHDITFKDFITSHSNIRNQLQGYATLASGRVVQDAIRTEMIRTYIW